MVRKKVVQVGYSLNPVVALAEPHNPLYTPFGFALRAYLDVFVLKKNVTKTEVNEATNLVA